MMRIDADNCNYQKHTEMVGIEIDLLRDALLLLAAYQRELRMQEQGSGVAYGEYAATLDRTVARLTMATTESKGRGMLVGCECVVGGGGS